MATLVKKHTSSLLLLLLLAHLCFAASGCDFTDQGGHKRSAVNGTQVLPLPSCDQVCPIVFEGACQCSVLRREQTASASSSASSSPIPVRLQCSQTNASILLRDIDNLVTTNCNFNLVELRVFNSNLTRLYHLPSGLYNVQELVLENTGIDLETIRESNELLRSLKILRISNENYTEIPETLFNGMDELKELSLNNLGLAYVSTDAFVSLQDSLTLLELRSNKIRSIPGAVHMLSHLECLDLSTNDIKTERTDGSVVTFSTGLKRLKRLRIKLTKCSCEFGRSKFATWLRTYAIKGVTCNVSDQLAEKDVSNTPVEEFCESPTNSVSSLQAMSSSLWRPLLVMLLPFCFLAKFSLFKVDC